jgi:hypothetical protein
MLEIKSDIMTKGSRISKSKERKLDSKILNKSQEIVSSGMSKPTNNIFKMQNLDGTESSPVNVESPKNLNHKTKPKAKETQVRKDSKEISKELKTPNNPLVSSSSKNMKLVKSNQIEKKQLTEKEIQAKVDDFRKKLMKDLLKILSEEKFKEEERELIYNKTTNLIEKIRLEKIIQMERALSTERILKMNE